MRKVIQDFNHFRHHSIGKGPTRDKGKYETGSEKIFIVALSESQDATLIVHCCMHGLTFPTFAQRNFQLSNSLTPDTEHDRCLSPKTKPYK